MSETYMLEPDLGFINEVAGLGGGDLKKCFQCATCSVACPIAPDDKPFPRKEMIAASWGLKDKLVANHDIWLCHNCGDCTTLCPRGAKPGEALGAIRAYAVSEYAIPKALGKAVNDPKKLPVLLAIPAILFLVIGLLTGLLDFTPTGEEVVHTKFFSTWLVDIIMIPAFFFAVVVFALGVKRFVNDIHENAVKSGKAEDKPLDMGGLVQALVKVFPTILAHKKFDECGENKERSTAHLLVFYSFIGLAIVTGIFFVALYILKIHGPYSQMNPVKWLGNISGVALIIGSFLLIQSRRAQTDQSSSYKDWYLLGLVFGLGVTGMGTEITRLAGWACVTYALYYVHLMLVFCLFVYTPFSKLAHLVYRTVAMAYAQYTGRT
ncbi:Heterodisulfide reductase [Candidatus Desulfarcum epimagneticum]|uniref:Heterodisulfide reductase n=1 Tax=uncultured Desulfobacteraceae bacterium TaxID=218296 RepID=A0A484HIZ4_9BACT|nr:Heterodisulfide reductase [uncultured Desulfobacteraceae bacterium]